MDWQWWVTNFLHIETLFVLGMIIAVIYYSFKGKKSGGQKYDFTGLGGIEIPHFGPTRKTKAVKTTSGRGRQRFNKHEERCREIFEKIFGVSFPSVRPKWLENPITGKNLEIDGWNDTIPTPVGHGLGFEYDGGQHGRYTPRFHKNVGDFQYQRAKDSWKDARFKQEKKVLIRIPDFVHYTDLERFICTKLRREGFSSWIDKFESKKSSGGGLYD